MKKYGLSVHLVEMDSDPDPDLNADPGRQTLDADSDPAKKLCRSDRIWIRIRIHKTGRISEIQSLEASR